LLDLVVIERTVRIRVGAEQNELAAGGAVVTRLHVLHGDERAGARGPFVAFLAGGASSGRET
jgi:hypothetical protein